MSDPAVDAGNDSPRPPASETEAVVTNSLGFGTLNVPDTADTPPLKPDPTTLMSPSIVIFPETWRSPPKTAAPLTAVPLESIAPDTKKLVSPCDVA